MSRISGKRRLKKAGLKGCLYAKKNTLLQPQSKKKRREWAKSQQNWTYDDWNQDLWADLSGSNGRVYACRQTGERLKAPCVTPTITHGGGRAMVWGCFADGKSMRFVWSKGYRDEGEVPLQPPAWCSSIGTKTRGSSLFCSKIMIPSILPSSVRVTETKKKCSSKDGLAPSVSRPLSAIELVWDELDRSVRKARPTNQQSLTDELMKAWNAILAHMLQKLVGWMPRIYHAVVKARAYSEESKV